MIGEDDAAYTYEYDDYYKILPAINDWHLDKQRIKEGRKVNEGFSYSSENNEDWMNIDSLTRVGKRKLFGMNLKNHISKLAIGTAQFGSDYGISNESGMVPLAKIEEILKTAESRNIKTIDTAISYGEAEKSLGMIGVDNFNGNY